MVVAMLMAIGVAAQHVVVISGGENGGEFQVRGTVRDRDTSGQVLGAQVRFIDGQDSIAGKGHSKDLTWNQNTQEMEYQSVFRVNLPKRKALYTMEIINEGYDTLRQLVDLRDMGSREFNRELGTFYIKRHRSIELNEVTVTASKVKFYYRGDTIVYNADAFQMAEGSMLDALIKQLPGVELKDGGQIYVNGEFVESLLLNGKDLFRGDNKILLDNLGAYTVQNVEVYRRQGERAKFLNLQDRSDKELVMDVKLKKEYVGGWSINVEGGGGTDDRYMMRLFGLHFNALSQFTLYANVNNLNDSEEISEESSWNPNVMGQGLKQFKNAGFNYSTQNEEGTRKLNGRVFGTIDRNNVLTTTNTVNFLPNQNTYERGQSGSLNRQASFGTKHELYFEKKLWNLKVAPSLRYSYDRSNSESSSAVSTSETLADSLATMLRDVAEGNVAVKNRESLINTAFNQAYQSNYNLNLQGRVTSTIKIPKTSDYIDLELNASHVNSHSFSDALYLIRYGDPEIDPTARNQHQSMRPNHTNRLEARASYTYVAVNKMKLMLSYRFNMQHASMNSAFYLGQLESGYTGDYTLQHLLKTTQVFDPSNSYNSTEKQTSNAVTLEWKWNVKDWTMSVGLPVDFIHNTLNYRQEDKDYRASVSKASFNGGQAFLQYYRSNRKGKSHYASLSYSVSAQAPQLINMIDRPNTTDPLNVYLGNPDLKVGYSHTLAGYFNRSHNGNYYNVNVYSTIKTNDFAMGYVYDTATGTRYYRTYNVNGNWFISASSYVNMQLFSKMRGTFVVSYMQEHNRNFISENSMVVSPSNMKTRYFGPRVEFDYSPVSAVKLEFKAHPSWQWSRSSLESAQSLSVREGEYSLKGVFRLPWDWGITTRLTLFTHRGYGDPLFDTSEWVWNARITKSFGKGRWIVAVDAFDLLHQLKNVTYAISPDARVETFTNTLPRYVLLHVQYRINIMPKKKLDREVLHF